MANISPVGWAEILLQLHNKFQPGLKSCLLQSNLTAHARVAFSTWADFPFRLHGLFEGLKIPAWVQKPG